MGLHNIRRGLTLPIQGAPEQRIDAARTPSRVAVVADDYPGMKPTMHVAAGDGVRTGQLLFEDKKTPGVRYTSPGTGTVAAVNRGAKRALQSVVIQLDPSDRGDGGVQFSAFIDRHPSSMSRNEVSDLLLESGMWTALRSRPFGKVATPGTTPKSIFVTAMDTNPLAPDTELIAEGRQDDLERGLHALGRLTDGKVFICTKPRSGIAVPASDQFQLEQFAGKHPAGTAGVHIHTLDPVNGGKTVWWIGLQDTLALGRLFATGTLAVDRVVSLAGPTVRHPRLLRTRLGASTDDLVAGELEPDIESRVISGSVLSGRKAMGEIHGYLGRYDQQISALAEDHERELFGWLAPGLSKYSVLPIYVSKLIPGRSFDLTTNTNGSHRAIVPIGLYEKVSPMDLVMPYVLKTLVMGDVEKAEELGALELVEEDVALCSFVCPGKIDYGVHLREVLTTIEKEG